MENLQQWLRGRRVALAPVASEAPASAAPRTYSPVHTVKPGTAYPATMIIAGDHDTRVMPAHSFKSAAALQAAHSLAH